MSYTADGSTSVTHTVGAYSGGWGAETTFDLSGSPAVGAAQKLVILKVSLGTYTTVAFRPLADAKNYLPSSTQGPFGVALCTPKTGDHALVITYTDSSGRVGAISSSGTPSATVVVMGACSLDVLGTPEVILSATGAPSSWSTHYTISALAGAEGLCVVRATPTSTNALQKLAARPSDSTDDTYGSYIGAGRANVITSGETALFLVPTDATGRLQLRSYSSGYTLDVDVVATVPGWTRSRGTVYGPAIPAAASTFYDMTAVGSDDNLALFVPKITAGTSKLMAVRESGDTGIYVDASSSTTYVLGAANGRSYSGVPSYSWCTTSSGVAQIASQYNSSTVQVDSVGYVSGTAPGSSIQCKITDPDSVEVDAIIDGEFQAGYAGTITANASNGYDVEITTHPAFSVGTWSAWAQCTDDDGVTGEDTWVWVVNSGPVVVGTVPAPLSIVGASGTVISWTTADNVSVDPATLNLEVTTLSGTSDAVIGGVAQAGWSFEFVANASNGYDCTATPTTDMELGAWSATATCEDGDGESGDDTWTWTVATAPSVISMYPSGVVPSVDQIRFQIADDAAFGLTPATLSISAIVSAGGQNTLWPAVVLGAVQDGWDITVTYPGATPTLMDVTIREWPFDLDGTYRRAEIVVDIDSTSGLSL